MLRIQQITTDPLQQQTLVLPDGTQLGIVIYFRPMQYGWFFNEITYAPKNFVLRGLRISNSPNMLHQWKNIVPFGIGCFSDSNREPSLQEDFETGASKLYILTADEVAAYTELLQSG